MTVEQADDINKLFVGYQDSIKVLNNKINNLAKEVRFASKQIEALDGTLNEVKTDNSKKDQEIVYYKEQMRRIEKLEWIDKRTRVRVGVGLAGILLAWTTLFIFSK